MISSILSAGLNAGTYQAEITLSQPSPASSCRGILQVLHAGVAPTSPMAGVVPDVDDAGSLRT